MPDADDQPAAAAAAARIVNRAQEVPEITVTDWAFSTAPRTLSAAADGEEGETDPRSEEALELIRQIDYYFSEENLPHDAHMLGLLKEGNGTVSFNEICGFKAMRKYKPKTWVRDIISKHSTLVEVCENNKRLRRKFPLETSPTVTPRVNKPEGAKATKPVPDDKPWLSKGMMKPTGFEEDADEAANVDAAQDAKDFDPGEFTFIERLQKAVTHFCARRKFHQEPRKIFDKYLTFGGFRGGQSQFIGGQDGRDVEDMTKKEKAEATAYYDVTTEVKDSVHSEDGHWRVGFEAVAKAFFSIHFPTHFAWTDGDYVKLATNVVRNFHNYLLLHRVCPEYENDIRAAMEICDLAEKEFPHLAKVDRALPGSFNVACSMLFGGHHSDQLAQGDWAQGEENTWTAEKAREILLTTINAHGSRLEVKAAAHLLAEDCPNKLTTDHKCGLEIVEIILPIDSPQSAPDQASPTSDVVKPMGKIICREWKVPTAPRVDLPAGVRDARHYPDLKDTHSFFLESEVLKHCYRGLKFEATIKIAAPGLTWIDYHEKAHASFYKYLANEEAEAMKAPGPLKGWMKKANAKVNGEGMEVGTQLDDAGESDDETLDW